MSAQSLCYVVSFLCIAVGAVIVSPLADDTVPDSIRAPMFRSNFRANFTIIAHLVDKTLEYPPWKRCVEVWYDAPRSRSKAYIHAGLEANKTFMRLHGQEDEYAFRTDDYAECRRSILVEPMPAMEAPAALRLHRRDHWYADRPVYKFVSRTTHERIIMLVDKDTGVPIHVSTEFRNDGRWELVMTWQLDAMSGEPVTDADFRLPPPFTHETCELVLGGWPSVHVFHHFLRV